MPPGEQSTDPETIGAHNKSEHIRGSSGDHQENPWFSIHLTLNNLKFSRNTFYWLHICLTCTNSRFGRI